MKRKTFSESNFGDGMQLEVQKLLRYVSDAAPAIRKARTRDVSVDALVVDLSGGVGVAVPIAGHLKRPLFHKKSIVRHWKQSIPQF